MIPQIRLMTLGLVTLTFVLEKRKRLQPRFQTFATAIANVCGEKGIIEELLMIWQTNLPTAGYFF